MKRESAQDLNRYLSQKLGVPIKNFQGKPRTSIEKENARLAQELGINAQDARDIQMGRAPSTLPIEVLNGNNGYVYLIRSSSHPKDTYKIGATKKTMQERLKGLNNTSMVTPFCVEEAFWVETDPFKFEREIHSRLAKYRINKKREFFKCSKAIILDVMEDVCGHKSTSREQFTRSRKTSLARHKMEQTLLSEWEQARKNYSDAIRAFEYIDNGKAAPEHDPLYNFKHSNLAYNYDKEINQLERMTKDLQSKYSSDYTVIQSQEESKKPKIKNAKSQIKLGFLVVFILLLFFSDINELGVVLTLLVMLGVYWYCQKYKQNNHYTEQKIIKISRQLRRKDVPISQYERFISTWVKNGLSAQDIQSHLSKEGVVSTIEEIEALSKK